MIRAVTVTTDTGESLRLELENPWTSGIAVKKIEGISPSSATVNIMDFATTDGGLHISGRIPSRTITLTLSPVDIEGQDIEQGRYVLYKMFPLKRMVTLEFESDHRRGRIEGYVQVCDVNIFSDQVEGRIEVACPQPYFYASDVTEQSLGDANRVNALFEFPFSNAGFNANLVLSDFTPNNVIPADYTGDAATGITFEIDILRNNDYDLTIARQNETQGISLKASSVKQQMRGTHAWLQGDKIRIYTHQGRKGVWLTRGNRTYNTLYAITGEPKWLMIYPGKNFFVYSPGQPDYFKFKTLAHIVYIGM